MKPFRLHDYITVITLLMSISKIILAIHILAGSVSIVSGMIALFAKKGARWHIKTGNIFFYAMLVMSITAVFLAWYQPYRTSLYVGFLTLYLVTTAQRTLQNVGGKNTYFEPLALVYILGLFAAGVIFCNQLLVTGKKLGMIDYFLFFYTGMAGLGGLLDITVVYRGGIYGRKRMARHIWRMCFALWIATGSLFLGQPRVFPKIIRDPLFLSTPVILVVVMWFFWLIKVFVTTRYRQRPKTL